MILKGALFRNNQHGYTFSKTFKDLNIPRRFGFKKRMSGNERVLQRCNELCGGGGVSGSASTQTTEKRKARSEKREVIHYYHQSVVT